MRNLMVKGGLKPMPENVKCSVSNCVYWGTGNKCQAELIMVEIDKHAKKEFNAEFAEIGFDSKHHDYAGDPSATCCHTFKPKAG
jgi:hypothetical protein